MRATYSLRAIALLLGFAAVGFITGCTNDEIVFVERPPFNDPADAASGFVGYYTSATKQTTCGNCHADFQAGWKETGHAEAYATLKANAGAQAFCYSCHTVTERGNAETGVIGHDKVQDSTYYDVQCESCHGPGLEHIQGVTQGQIVRPLARIGVGPDTSSGCAACHTGTHHPFVEEWSLSGHAVTFPAAEAGNASCTPCHEARGAIKAWGVESNYSEREQTEFQPVATCATCHNPHGSPNSANLRWSISDPEPSRNLCMKCHDRRTQPTPGSSRGNAPHAPQGSVLMGDAGYRAAGFTYDTATVFASHSSTRNPRLCAGCHVNQYTINDPASGNFVFQVHGHTFLAAPCVDTQGIPTGSTDCAYTTAAREFSACAGSGCHASTTVALNALLNSRDRIEQLAATIWVDGDNDETVDVPPTDQGYLPTIKATIPGELNPSDSRVSPADGAEFNLKLCAERYANGDKSKGVHNPFLCEALLRANIDELRASYGLPSPPLAVLQMLKEPLGGVKAKAVRISQR
ncbi:MAG TPA: cytochrome c3 family protein [Gemmatimonadales bacterium]